MNNKFDELTKTLAQSVTRRAALKKFGAGIAAIALACFGLANKAQADKPCSTNADCLSRQVCCNGACVAGHDWCDRTVNYCCCYCVVPKNKKDQGYMTTALTPCDSDYTYCGWYCGSALGCA